MDRSTAGGARGQIVERAFAPLCGNVNKCANGEGTLERWKQTSATHSFILGSRAFSILKLGLTRPRALPRLSRFVREETGDTEQRNCDHQSTERRASNQDVEAEHRADEHPSPEAGKTLPAFGGLRGLMRLSRPF